MRTAKKATKTFSLDRSVLAEIERTKGTSSESERVNSLLKFALDIERRAALYQEAGRFFARNPDDRQERDAYESAALSAWTRE
jgi:hypothetical protein